MATTRPFAFNTGSTISGTEQIGNLAIGENNRDYSGDYGGVRWWMGPDEDLGYVIAQPRSSNDQPTQPGIVPPFGSVGFWRTVGFLDSSFIQLSEYVSDKSGFPQTFNTGAEAKTWLNDNGYWTSYIESPITPTPTPTVTSTNTQTPTPTNTQTPTPTNTQTPTPTNTQTPTPTGVNQLIDPIIVGFDEYLGVGVDEYLMFVDPVTPGVSPTPTQTPTNTPTQTPTNTPTQTPTNTPTQTPTNTPTQTPTNTSTQTPTQTSTNTPTPSVTPTSSEIPVTPTPTSTPTPTPSSAPFSVTMIESGSDVVLSFAGALDLTGLNFVQNQQVNGGGVGAAQAAFGIGPATLQNISLYTGATFSYPSNFGPGGGGPGGGVSGSGDYFGVFSGIFATNCLVVPTGYTSNTYIAGTTTLSSSSFSSLGMTQGNYNYSWGAGPGQSFVLTIGGSGVTPTPTATSVTPTPTPTPVTGYGYNLVVLPYNPPSSGNTIFPSFNIGGTSGITNPNTFNVNGVYWNIIDNLGVNRSNYYSGMTGVSVTAYFTQNGETAIYSGSTTAFTLEGPPGQESFNYNPNTRPNQLTLIQSANTNFITGQTVYISFISN